MKESASQSSDARVSLYVVLAGLALVPLLPIGVFLGTTDRAFIALSAAFLVLQSFALIRSIQFFVELLPAGSFAKSGFLLPLLVVLGAAGALCALPVTAPDALIHHLIVGRWWAEHGSIYPIPWHEWSFYPMLADLPYVGASLLHLEQWTAFIQLSYLPIFAALTSGIFLRATESRQGSLLLFLLALTVPAIFRSATVPLVDLSLATYSVASIWYLQRLSTNSRSTLSFVFFGIALGLALSTKYNGLLFAALVGLAALPFVLSDKNATFGRFILYAMALMLAAIIFAPWVIKNALWTGNPLYPQFGGLFPATLEKVPLTQGLSPLATRRALYGESWLAIAAIPFRMFFAGQDNDPRRFDGVLTPLFFLIVPSLLFIKKSAFVRLNWLVVVGYVGLALFLSSARVRYLAPVWGSLLVLTAYGVHGVVTSRWILARAPLGVRRLLIGGLALSHLLFFSFYLASLTSQRGLLTYMLEPDSRSLYLEERVPAYKMTKWMNQNLSSATLTDLLFTGDRFFYHLTPVRSAGHYSGQEILYWIKASSSPAVFKSEFTRRGITHLFVNNTLLTESLKNNLTEQQQTRWNEFQQQHLEFLQSGDGYSVWAIK